MMLLSFGEEELRCAKLLLNRRLKKIYDRKTEPLPKRSWQGPRIFTGRRPPVRNPPQSVIPPGDFQLEIVPNEPIVDLPRPWYKTKPDGSWRSSGDFVAFDVEAASRYIKFLDNEQNPPVMWRPVDKLLPQRTTITEWDLRKRIPKAAYVSVVDYKYNIVYQATIQHKPGTFHVDHFSKVYSGIVSTNQLKDGTPFQTVVTDFTASVKKKCIITCGGGCDFRYLELASSKFEHWDLQNYYQRSSEEHPDTYEPMSLQDIYFYHFKEDCQRGKHDATSDATATMRIFREGYRFLDPNNPPDFTDTPRLKRLAKMKLFWCSVKKEFLNDCKCCK